MPFPSVAASLLIGADRPRSLILREVFGQLPISPRHDALDRHTRKTYS
jgi:hypothetical protein